MYDGLKFTYAGYGTRGPEFHPMNGTLLKDKPIAIWNFSDTTRLRYTTDGAEPTLASAKMGKETILSGPAKLSVRQFSNRAKFDKTTTGDFKLGTLWPALLKVKKIKPGGFHYTYYEGNWDKLPDFTKLKPVQEGIANKGFDINKLPRQNNFALLMDGWIELKEEGYYIFGIVSDDGSKVFLGNKLLLDNDGLHGSTNVSYIVPLQKGFYPVRIEYFQKDGGRDLKLIYITPSNIANKIVLPVPFELQYSK